MASVGLCHDCFYLWRVNLQPRMRMISATTPSLWSASHRIRGNLL